MNPMDENAITAFLKDGGQLQKMQDHGYVKGGSRLLGYLRDRSKVSSWRPEAVSVRKQADELDSLVALANQHRLTRQLQPFAVRR